MPRRASPGCRPRRNFPSGVDPSKVGSTGLLRYSQRVEAIDFVHREIQNQIQTLTDNMECPKIEFTNLPLNFAASMLFRVTSSNDALEAPDLWLPILVRSSSYRYKSGLGLQQEQPQSSTRNEVDYASPSYRYFRCEPHQKERLQYGPLLCVAPREGKMFLQDSFYSRFRTRFKIPTSAAVDATAVRDFLIERWNTTNETKKMPFDGWVRKLQTRSQDKPTYDGLLQLRKILYEPLGYRFEFSPTEQSDINLCNARLGQYRVVHRRASQHWRGFSGARSLKVLLATSRLDGIVFSGPGTNIHLLDFLVVFHNSVAANGDIIAGVFIFPRKVIEDNLNDREENFCPCFSLHVPTASPRYESGRQARQWQEPYYIDLTRALQDAERATVAQNAARKIFTEYPQQEH
ncbi:unnamed protein product [Amoebophrya sp. A120]|nr:unnamed protein product [Amoebophrya sp. A120]|eukprot:GSA120T00021294001.1